MSDSQKYHIRLATGEQFGPADMPLIEQWAHQGRVPKDAMLVPVDGGEPINVLDRPELVRVISAPPTVQGKIGDGASTGDEGIATLIPYRNPTALTGYYLAIGSLIPLLGTLLGPIAIVLGIIGLRKRAADPRIHGLAHAWIAIVVGLVGTLISVGCLSGFFFTLFN